MRFSSLRGFDDHLPPDAGARSEILRRMRAAARLAGFQELEPPSVESLELFTAKSGAEIAKELWSFTDKGGRAVALITESTPSLARIYSERASAEPLPVKWFTVARVWRYQEPQAGRAREFHQFNLDILGASGLEAEVELLSVGAMLLDSAGAAGLYGFRLSDRPLAESIGRTLGATDLPRFFRALDSLRKVPADATRAELAASGLAREGVDRLWSLLERSLNGVPLADAGALFDELAACKLTEPGPAGLDRLRRLSELLPRAGVADRVRIDLSVVRGLDYYTGPVFEAYDLKGEGRALFGGGRYDTLIESFGGPPTAACGLAIGDLTLELLLRAHGRWPEGEPPLDTFVVAVTPEMVPQAIELLARLRRAGVSADADLLGRSLSRQLKEAARRRARRALLVGPRELARGAVLERDLASGAQTERPLTQVTPGA
ncbi:MAG TPA: histidine--tRNA ligase [Thermoplasmata archaeon]|nr:histidine--tRNA ligase [Thermoplasmata archaeon]